MSWTDERVELLRQLWLDGKSASQISAALGNGLTRNAVIGKVHRLGLAGRAKSPASVSSGAPRAASPKRAAARAATAAATVVSSHVVHGNTVMTVKQEALLEAAPVGLEQHVVVPMSLRVTIVELKEAMCKWPLGDPSSAEFRYCGSPSSGFGPYCGHHAKLAYQPAQDHRRRDRDRERRTLFGR